jgi:hypothetical protein
MDIYNANLVKVEDPIIDGSQRLTFPIVKGGQETTEREFVSSTFSNSSTQFSVPPPNPQTYVSRRIMLKQPVRITLSGDTLNSYNLYQSDYDAFRQMPLHSVIQTLDIVLNGQSTSINMNDVIKPLLLFHNNERDLGEREFSLSPACRDQSQQYEDLIGSVRNPLSTIVSTNPRSQAGRGAFPYDSIVNNAGLGVQAVIEATLCEELMLSPLLFGGVRDEGFIGLQKIEMNITWDNNLAKMWSHSDSDNVTLNSVSVELLQPSLLFRYVTPPLIWKQPSFSQYCYNEIQRYPTTGQQMLADGRATLTSNNIQLNSIPRFIYLFARRQNSEQSFNTTDSYMSINGVRVNWNNQNALLSNASQQQLYDISRKNGFDGSWLDWSAGDVYAEFGSQSQRINGIGSVLCLEMGVDIGLKDDECPGMIGTYNLQVELDVTNKSQSTLTPTLYIITVINGVFTIYDNSASKRIGVVSKKEAMEAKEQMGIDYYGLQKNLMSGGFNLKKVGKLAKRLGRQYKKYRDVLPIPSQYKAALDVASNLAGSGYVGGRRRRGRKPGPKKRRKANVRR